jgi:hypothetical protein
MAGADRHRMVGGGSRQELEVGEPGTAWLGTGQGRRRADRHPFTEKAQAGHPQQVLPPQVVFPQV